jgi:hypothetical protein
MRGISDEELADHLVLGIWAAIVLLGDARHSSLALARDIGRSTALLSKAERILSGVIPHIVRWGLISFRGPGPGTLH